MPCCSSCGLPIQGHQIPKGPRCSILFDETTHALGWEPECTVCLQQWSSHPQGKHIPKDCKFHWQQALGDPVADNLEQAEDGDVHTRLTHTREPGNEGSAVTAHRAGLVAASPAKQAPPQPAGGKEPSAPAPLEATQAASTSSTAASLPSPSWLWTKDWERTLGGSPASVTQPCRAAPSTTSW